MPWVGNGKFGYAVLLIGIFLAPALVFWPVHQFEFVKFDDGIHVSGNPAMNPPTVAKIAAIWKKPYQGLYIPLTYTVWAVLAHFSPVVEIRGETRLSPLLFHVANWGLHSLNGVLLFLLFLRLTIPRFAAFLGCLMFLWHPLQVEPVAWISSLKDLLAGTGVLFALWQYVIAAQTVGAPRWRHYVLALIGFGLGALAKPAALVFPLLAGIVDLAILRRPWRVSLPAWAPWLLVSFFLGWVTKRQQPDALMEFVTPWVRRPFLMGDALTFYLAKLTFPIGLTLNYGRSPQRLLEQPWTYFAWLIPVLLTAALLWRTSRRRWLIPLALFVVYLLPVLGILPFYYQRYATVADRFVYLALMGPALALAWWLMEGKRWRVGVAVVWLVGLAILSRAQLEIWRDSRELVKHVARLNPRDPEVQYSLAVVYSEDSELPGETTVFRSSLAELEPEKRTERSRRDREQAAIYHYQEAIRLNPAHYQAHNNLGLVFRRIGKLQAAEMHFREATRLAPDSGDLFNNLGVVLAEQRRFSEAAAQFTRATELSPTNEKLHVNLGMAREGERRMLSAQAHYLRAIEINARSELARQKLADNLVEQGDYRRAIPQYETILRYSPENKTIQKKLAVAKTKLVPMTIPKGEP